MGVLAKTEGGTKYGIISLGQALLEQTIKSRDYYNILLEPAAPIRKHSLEAARNHHYITVPSHVKTPD